MESSNRNNQGRFVSGHKGAKPKGAMNKNTREYLVRLEKINNILETNLEDNILSMSKKEQVMLWLELQKIMHIKMSKFTEPEPEKERIDKIIFEVVEGGKPEMEMQSDPSKESGSFSGNPQHANINAQSNNPIQVSSVETGNTNHTKKFKTIRSI